MVCERREASACLTMLSAKQGSHWCHFYNIFGTQEFEFLSIEQETRPKKAISNKRVWKTSKEWSTAIFISGYQKCKVALQDVISVIFLGIFLASNTSGLVSCSMDRNSNSCVWYDATRYRSYTHPDLPHTKWTLNHLSYRGDLIWEMLYRKTKYANSKGRFQMKFHLRPHMS